MTYINLSDLQKAHTSRYVISLTDGTIQNPFELTPELQLRANSIRASSSADQLPFTLFEYLLSKLSYGKEHGKEYANSTEVWDAKQGVCGELSYLYLGMARFCGVNSTYVHVSKDFENKPVNHACIGVRPQSKQRSFILVDLAYQQFDIKHKTYTTMSDAQVVDNFGKWRKETTHGFHL